MMMTFLLLYTAWIFWCICAARLSGARTAPEPWNAYTVGAFRPVINMEGVRGKQLTVDEFNAVYMHELGHVHHRHCLVNLVLGALLPPIIYCDTIRVWQERQADQYAFDHGYKEPLLSARRKLEEGAVLAQARYRAYLERKQKESYDRFARAYNSGLLAQKKLSRHD